METLKAGCFLIDKVNQSIALIYREKQKDYSFPKGHVDPGEDIRSTAIRETAEEIKRVAIILDEYEPFVERYTTPMGEKCACYMYIALDGGISNNTSEDTHQLIWTKFDKVEETLSYDSLRNTWRAVKSTIKDIIEK